MKPTVGRIVHYQSHGSPNGQHLSEPRAAIITRIRRLVGPEVDTPTEAEFTVDLCVLNPTGMYFDRETPFSPTPQAGCWSWPPRE